MKLLSFELAGKPRFGALAGDGVVDLTDKLGAGITTLRAALEADALGRIKEVVAKAKPDHALAGLKLASPIPFPEKIICVGVNYGNRNAEYKDGSDLPKYPSIFLRFPGSLVGHGGKLMRPPESEQLDYEGEIGIIIGKGGRRISEEASPASTKARSVTGRSTASSTSRKARPGKPAGRSARGWSLRMSLPASVT